MTKEDWEKLVEYNPDKGTFIWRVRDDSCYSRSMDRKRFNTWRAGNDASSKTSEGYRKIRYKGKSFYAHRVAWLMTYGTHPSGVIDHINHDGSDNRISNLASVSHIENMQNQKLRPDNKSGCTGVRFDKRIKKWRASIVVNKKYIGLGSFAEFKDAKAARMLANAKHKFNTNHGLQYGT